MQRLQVDYLDLVLIHWPNPRAFQANDAWKERNAGVWQALEKGYQDGKIRAIGVSNFRIHHLKELFKTAQVKPMVNQIKLSPGLTQDELVAFCRQEDILVEAYSPLGRGKAFTNDSLKAMADKYQVTVAQLCLQFSVQNGFLPLPRSKTPKNIEANLQWPAFAIAPEDMAALKVLPDLAKASDPDQADF